MKDDGDDAVEDSNASLEPESQHIVERKQMEILTMLRVPTSSWDGVSLALTIWEMKFAAMPMQPSKEITWSVRTILKVAPRAP